MEVYASNPLGIGGRIRQLLEDFIVEEVLADGSMAQISQTAAQQPLGEGRHLVCVLVKRDWDTLLAVKRVARQLRISQRRIQIAGMKDAKALTAQHVSLSGVAPEHVRRVKVKDIDLYPLRFSNEMVFPHLLLGNRFRITVRAVSHSTIAIERRVKGVQEELSNLGGFPNFFGHQRFGTVRPITHLVGKFIVLDRLEKAIMTFLAQPSPYEHPESREARKQLRKTRNFEEALHIFPKNLRYERLMLTSLAKRPEDYVGAFRRIPRRLRKLFVQAYQSHLFNLFLSQRIKLGVPLTEAQIGDYAVALDEHGLPTAKVMQATAQSLSDIDGALREGKMRLAIPLIGFKQSPSQGIQGEIEGKILENEGIASKDFKVSSMPETSATGELRTILTPVINFSAPEISKDPHNPSKRRVTLGFTLHRGSYATVLLREFMKPRNLIRAGF